MPNITTNHAITYTNQKLGSVGDRSKVKMFFLEWCALHKLHNKIEDQNTHDQFRVIESPNVHDQIVFYAFLKFKPMMAT